MIFLPFALSFSFGVMAALLLSGLLTFIFYFRPLVRKRRVFNGLIFFSGFSVAVASIIYFFFRNSFFVLRLVNIFSGRDSSGKGRTSDAFFLANKLLEKKDEYWGVGFGQIKIIGADVIRHYYMYGENFVATIPNAVAETYTILGWTGVTLRMLVEVFFFFQTRGLDKLLQALAFLIHIYISVCGKLHNQCCRICDLDIGIYECL
jgi:hypothetical protein